MRTADPDLHETFAPLREVEPTPEDVARVLAMADELRSPRSLAAPRRRAGRTVALVAATAAVIGAIAALPGGEDSSRPQDAHGVFQAAAAVAAEQPAPLAYRYTRAVDRFVYGVNAADGQRGRVAEEQTSENWTSDGWKGRTTGARGTSTWSSPPSAELLKAAGGLGAAVKPYDGDYRYGDGPLARVPFAAIPPTPPRPGSCSRPPSATAAGCRTATPTPVGRPASSRARSRAARSCCSRWATSRARSARPCSSCSARAPAPTRWAGSPTRPDARASASRCVCPTSATSCG